MQGRNRDQDHRERDNVKNVWKKQNYDDDENDVEVTSRSAGVQKDRDKGGRFESGRNEGGKDRGQGERV